MKGLENEQVAIAVNTFCAQRAINVANDMETYEALKTLAYVALQVIQREFKKQSINDIIDAFSHDLKQMSLSGAEHGETNTCAL